MSTRNFNRLAPPVLWAVLIFINSQMSRPPKPPAWMLFPHMDKAAHAGLFGILCILIARAFSKTETPAVLCSTQKDTVAVARKSCLQIFGVSVLLTSLYGGFDEWHQSFVPGRTPDLLDWLADTTGALLAGGLYLYAWKLRQKQ